MAAIITHAQPDGAPQFDELTETTAIIGPYVFADISTYRKYELAYDALIDAHNEDKFVLSKRTIEMLVDLDNRFKWSRNTDKWVWNFRKAEQRDERKFFLDIRTRDSKDIDLYPIVWRDAESDGRGGYTARVRVLLMATLENQTQASRLTRMRGQVRWKRDATGFHISFFDTKAEARDDLLDLDDQDNIEIVNLDEAIDSLKHVKVRRSTR